MIPSAEARAQRLITDAFIEADLSEIVLIPRTKVSNGAGGFVWEEGELREAQGGRVIPINSNQNIERTSPEGNRVIVEFILIMQWDAEVAVADRFESRGRTFEVIHIQEKRDYQIKSELITVG